MLPPPFFFLSLLISSLPIFPSPLFLPFPFCYHLIFPAPLINYRSAEHCKPPSGSGIEMGGGKGEGRGKGEGKEMPFPIGGAL